MSPSHPPIAVVSNIRLGPVCGSKASCLSLGLPLEEGLNFLVRFSILLSPHMPVRFETENVE